MTVPSSPVLVRRAHLDDVPALALLLEQLFAQEAEFMPDRARQERGLTAILSDPATGRILLAELGRRAVGMVNLLYTVSTARGGRVAILEDMIVAKGHRNHGIGDALMRSALATAREDGCLRITLLTDADNTRAHAFYARHGFSVSPMMPMRLSLEKPMA